MVEPNKKKKQSQQVHAYALRLAHFSRREFVDAQVLGLFISPIFPPKITWQIRLNTVKLRRTKEGHYEKPTRCNYRRRLCGTKSR